MLLSLSIQSGHEADGFVHTVGDHDVVFGRGGFSYCHAGNRLFRRLVQHNRELYRASMKSNHRSSLAFSIVSAIHSTGGRFLRKQDGTSYWKCVNVKDACVKTSQALRDANVRTRKCSSAGSFTKSSSSEKSEISFCSVQPKKGPNRLTPSDHSSSPRSEPPKIVEITTTSPFPEASADHSDLNTSEIEIIDSFANYFVGNHQGNAVDGEILRQSFQWLSGHSESPFRMALTRQSSECSEGLNHRLSIKLNRSTLQSASNDGIATPLDIDNCPKVHQQQRAQNHHTAQLTNPNPRRQARYSTSSVSLLESLLRDEDWIEDWDVAEDNNEIHLGVDCHKYFDIDVAMGV
jgi:hypothetical protein